MSNCKQLPIALTTKRNCDIKSALFNFKDSVRLCFGVPEKVS